MQLTTRIIRPKIDRLGNREWIRTEIRDVSRDRTLRLGRLNSERERGGEETDQHGGERKAAVESGGCLSSRRHRVSDFGLEKVRAVNQVRRNVERIPCWATEAMKVIQRRYEMWPLLND